ncbi:MAG: bacteriophage holin [Gammaproteobacteria bacterium]|nr:bacteriophage holin [Gammaproteobacteria bacterium]
MAKKYARLEVMSFAITAAIIWSIIVFAMAILSETVEYGLHFVQLFSTLYVGYHSSLLGGIVGAIWGLVDAFITCFAFAWLYNLLCEHFDR